MAEVGTVYVQVMPTTKGFAKALGSQGSVSGAAAGKAFNVSFGKIIGGSAIGNIISNTVSKVTGAISGSMDAAINRADTLNNFPKIMENLGYSASEADGVIKDVIDHLQGLPTTSQEMVSFVKQLESTTGSLSRGSKLGLAFNDMLLAGGASATEASNAMVQFNQMLAAGKVDMQSWQSVLLAAPKQLNQLSEKLLGAGKGQKDLYEALKKGKISMTQFQDAIVDLAKNGGDGFAAWEVQAKTATGGIATSMNLVQTRVASSVQKIISHIGVDKIAGAIDAFSSSFSGIADVAIEVIDAIASKVDFAGFESAFKGVSGALAEVFSQGDSAVSFGEGIGNMINMLIPAIQAATPIIQLLASLFKFCAENAGVLIPTLVVLAIVITAIKAALNCAPLMEKFTGGLTKMKPAVAANVPQLLALAVAAIGLGLGIALAAVGVYILVQAAMQLVSAGPMAAIALVGLVAVIALLAIGAAALGPALTAGAVGFIAFGAAILMVSIGIALVVMAFTMLAGQLPLIATYGLQAAAGILAISASMIVFTVAAVLAGVGMIVAAAGLGLLGVAALAAAVGVGAFSAAIMMVAIGVMLAGVGIAVLATAVGLLAAAVTATATGLTQMADALPAIASNAPGAAAGLGALAAASGGAALGIGASVGPLSGLAAAAAAAASSTMMLGTGLSLSFSAAFMLALAISAASGALSGAAGTFSGSCASMAGSFDQIRSRAQAAMNGAVSAVKNAASRINGTKMTARVEIQVGKLPHFSMTGSFNAETGSVPSISVNWYGGGGLFRRPSIIGVGEAGTEVVENVDRLDKRIRKAVRSEGASGKKVTQNFTINTNDPELVAAKVAARTRRSH